MAHYHYTGDVIYFYAVFRGVHHFAAVIENRLAVVELLYTSGEVVGIGIDKRYIVYISCIGTFDREIDAVGCSKCGEPISGYCTGGPYVFYPQAVRQVNRLYVAAFIGYRLFEVIVVRPVSIGSYKRYKIDIGRVEADFGRCGYISGGNI